MAESGEDNEVPPPDFLVPGIRCGLEMALVGLSVALVGLPTDSALFRGLILLAAFLSMLVVFFWCLNQHIAEWIRHARGQPTMADGGLED